MMTGKYRCMKKKFAKSGPHCRWASENGLLFDPGEVLDEKDEVVVEDEDGTFRLGLNSATGLARIVKPNLKNGDPSPTTILDDLVGQLSDGMWENTPAMTKYWINMHFDDSSGELVLKTNPQMQEYGGKYYTNPFYTKLGGDVSRIREWLANHLKVLVKDEVGDKGWDRTNEQELDYFSQGTTVAMVYAVYDILKNRGDKGKNPYYDAFKA